MNVKEIKIQALGLLALADGYALEARIAYSTGHNSTGRLWDEARASCLGAVKACIQALASDDIVRDGHLGTFAALRSGMLAAELEAWGEKEKW